MTLGDRMTFGGRVALATGGAGDISRAIAQQLRDLGAIVALADRPGASEGAAEGLGGAARNMHSVAMDVTDSRSVDDAIASAVRRIGRIVLLVAAAGISYEEDALNHRDESWRRFMSINVDGVFDCMRGVCREIVTHILITTWLRRKTPLVENMTDAPPVRSEIVGNMTSRTRHSINAQVSGLPIWILDAKSKLSQRRQSTGIWGSQPKRTPLRPSQMPLTSGGRPNTFRDGTITEVHQASD